MFTDRQTGRRTAGRQTKKYRISSPGLFLKNFSHTLWLFNKIKHNGNLSLINKVEYMYIMSYNDRKCQTASKCLLRNGTEARSIFIHSFRSFQCILFVKKQLFLSQRPGRGIVDYVPFWPPGQYDLTKLAHCTSRSCMLQRKIEKVPRGIRGEKSSKDMASSRNLVSTIGALASPKMGDGTRCPENKTTIRPLRHIPRVFF